MRIKTIDGKKYILHKVVKKETWTSIAKKYNTTIDELMSANKGVSVLKTGQIIQVPLKEAGTVTTDDKKPVPAAAEKPAPKTEVVKTKSPKYHTAKSGESLYGISKKYNSSVDDIKKWNKISGSNIKPGQKIIVGYTETEKTVVSTAKETDADNATISSGQNKEPFADQKDPVDQEPETSKDDSQVKKEYIKSTSSGKNVNQVTETGEAAWVNDSELNPNKFYALHRTAPIGTIAKVTNKMNGKSVFVKVIGRLPNTGDNFNVMIKISKAAADKVGVIDEKFIAEISYAMAN